MRISDWSSDVCSSDLRVAGILRRRVLAEGREDLDLLAELDRVGQRQGAGINLAGHRRHGRGIAAAVGHELEVGAGGFAESEHTRSEEHTSELQSLMRISYAVFCLKKKKYKHFNSNLHT